MPVLMPTNLPLNAHLGGEELALRGEGAPPPPGVPTSGDALTTLAQEEYNLDEEAALSLGYAVAQLQLNAKHAVLIFQAARYADVSVADVTYRYGVAIEATIVATTASFKGGLTLPVIAANVELGLAEASSRLAVRGFAPTDDGLQLPSWGSFGVDSYGDFRAKVSALQEAVLFKNEQIRPVLLATTQPPAERPETRPRHKFWIMGHDGSAGRD